MTRTQSLKKTVVQAGSRLTLTYYSPKDAVISVPRNPRTICMTKEDLYHLRISFDVNPWPDRDEKLRLADRIGKSYQKVNHWFSNQRQKMAAVEKAKDHDSSSSESSQPLRSGPTVLPKRHQLESETPSSPSPSMPRSEADSESSEDISVEHGARLLLDFAKRAQAEHRAEIIQSNTQ
ncbi:hypothetical protein BC834DRAFT_846540 [Gloeopeniophorella convolvens]|nr:hypothetical protein BC834DRAFT_846540 [Gloeopeniophorella convolvens]